MLGRGAPPDAAEIARRAKLCANLFLEGCREAGHSGERDVRSAASEEFKDPRLIRELSPSPGVSSTAFLANLAASRASLASWTSAAHRTLATSLQQENTKMNISGESLLVILVVGLVAGWLAGQIVRGGGFGLVGDILIGIVGAFIGDWLLPRLGIHLGVGIVAAIIDATIGAVVLLLIIRLVSQGSRGGYGWGRARR
jgi:uncharacterized membrane protein YeaQ/YmgE (transglycosylase-associated protein family)